MLPNFTMLANDEDADKIINGATQDDSNNVLDISFKREELELLKECNISRYIILYTFTNNASTSHCITTPICCNMSLLYFVNHITYSFNISHILITT